jgi:sec-independent protein translocase protein TatA
MRLGTGELLIVLVVVLLVFGPTKLPQFGDALGRGIRNFKKATSDFGSSDTTSERVAPQAKLNAGSRAVAQPASAAAADVETV